MWNVTPDCLPVADPPRPAGPWTDARVPALCAPPPPSGATEWFPPAMAGAREIERRLFQPGVIRDALRLIERLSPDDYAVYVTAFLRDGLARFGDEWRYADIVTTLTVVARMIRPRRYLEIGVRRGRSLCAVAAQSPDCALYALDQWIADYAGMPNPGPEAVRDELAKIGHCGAAHFISGDSRRTLPTLLAEQPDLSFDLITVDGDHSTLGAARDLCDVLPRLNIGGAVVFDDVSHPALPGLKGLWRDLVTDDPRFSALTYDDVGYGVGVAIRKF